MLQREEPKNNMRVIDEAAIEAMPRRKKKTSSKPRKMSNRDYDAALSEMNELREAERYAEFQPRHFVAFYCALHSIVYKVRPDEVRNDYRFACGAAMRMLKNEFSGDAAAMVEFIKWVWFRENGQFKRRSPDNDFRIGWRYQFGPKLLTDYRMAMTRAKRSTR